MEALTNPSGNHSILIVPFTNYLERAEGFSKSKRLNKRRPDLLTKTNKVLFYLSSPCLYCYKKSIRTVNLL